MDTENLRAEIERLLGLLQFAERCLERNRTDGAREAMTDAVKRAEAALAVLRGCP